VREDRFQIIGNLLVYSI